MKTFYISADTSCAGRNYIYVICPENLLDKFLGKCGFGCSQCRHYQELPMMEISDVDYFVSENGEVFSKLYKL